MGSMLSNIPMIANGNINVSTFVKIDTTRDYAVIQAAAGTDKPLAISQQGPRTAPNLDQALFGQSINNYAAIAGDQLKMFYEGDVCPLTAGTGGWNPGDLLMSDANGNGVTWTSGNWYGARALSAANAGETGEVQVVFGH